MATIIVYEEYDTLRWNPSKNIVYLLEFYMGSSYKKEFKRLFRNSSSGFCSRKDVRDYVFKRDNYKCVECASTDNLQVDHIIPVASATAYNYKHINVVENLQTLCSKCNQKKIDHRDGKA